MERRPRKFAVSSAIILLAISVIQFRFDEMTTRHSLAIERLLTPLSAAREPNRCALRTAS